MSPRLLQPVPFIYHFFLLPWTSVLLTAAVSQIRDVQLKFLGYLRLFLFSAGSTSIFPLKSVVGLSFVCFCRSQVCIVVYLPQREYVEN